MGWSSWTSFGCAVTGQDLNNSADAMVSQGLAAAGYDIVHVDDCWMLKTRGGDGVLGNQVPDPDKFPQGIEAVVAHIKAAGLKFGIYTARGDHTCQGRAASCLHELTDAAYYKSIGVDFLKDDSCSVCAMHAAGEGDVQTDYERMQMSIDKVGGNMSLFFEGQPDITVVYTGRFGNGRRVGHDISPNWYSMISLADIGSGLWPYAHTDTGSGSFFNWEDFIQVGRGDFVPTSTDPTNETDIGGVRARTHMALYAAMKSPLFLGNDLSGLTDAEVAVLTAPHIIAINQDSMGVQARRVQSIAPANTTIVLDGKHGMPVLAKCDAGDPLQAWRFAPAQNTSTLNIAPCDAADPKQQWAGLLTTATGSHMRNAAVNGCLDASTAADYELSAAACDSASASQDFWLEASSKHIRFGDSHNCLDIYDFHGPNVFFGSCKTPGDQDSNQQFALDPSTGLVHAGAPNSTVPAGMCLSMNTVPGGRIYLPASAGDFSGLDGKPAVCLEASSGSAGSVQLRGCDPASPVPDASTAFVLQPYTSEAAVDSTGGVAVNRGSVRGAVTSPQGPGNYTITQPSRGTSLTWNTQFGASGPVPHSRWLTGRGDEEAYTCDPAAPAGSPIRALSDQVIDDDGVGHVTTGGDFCIAASYGGNLEVWAGPLTGSRYVVVMVNRAAATETFTASWSALPPHSAPGEAERARAEGRAVPGPEPAPAAAASSFSVMDAWTGAAEGTFSDGFTATIPSLGSRTLILTPA